MTQSLRADLRHIPDYVPGKVSPTALKLSSNEVHAAPSPAVVAAMQEASAHANRYPDMAVTALREALAKDLGLEASQVAVGCGSSALCQGLVQICAGVGDEVVFPWRSFEAYPIFTQVVGATPVAVPLDKHGRNDLEAMAAAITPKTRLVFVCNPNNPTGTIVSAEQFEAFMAAVPDHVIVALDEAYIEYVRSATVFAPDYLERYPNLVGLRTFSKAYGLAGLRVGYAFGAPEIIAALNKVALPFGVNAVAQAGALAALAEKKALLAHTEEVVRNRSRVVEALGLYDSEANFVWVPAKTPEQAQEFSARLAQRDVLVRCFPEGVRITITNDEEINTLLKALEK